MMRVGWCVDPGVPVAGMVLQVRAYEAAKPDDIEIVHCPLNRRPPDDIDAYVTHGDLYGPNWLDIWQHKPLMAHRHGAWIGGDPHVRRWVLDNADLVTFNSPKQLELFPYPINAKWDLVPTPVDVERFQEAAARSEKREGTVFIGLIHPSKGISTAMDWAIRNNESLDLWGGAYVPKMLREIVPPGVYRGVVDYDEIPALLARYESYIFMPYDGDLYSRTVIEAKASGCKLILQGDTQAFYDYLDLDACQRGGEIFWEKFRTVIDG